jgi:hypothetical protein
MMGSSKAQEGKEISRTFGFQEIPLDEAVDAVIAGDGNYAVIKAKLLEALPALADGKAFAFGLPDGKEVPEDLSKGAELCMRTDYSAHLKKAKIGWRVTYSSLRKLFICVPTKKPMPPELSMSRKVGGLNADNSQIVRRFGTKVLSVRKIVEQTGEDLGRDKFIRHREVLRRAQG